MVAPQVKAYVGIDYAQSMLDLARRRNERFANASFVLNDGITIPFADASFDCIYCDLVLQHVVRSNTTKILTEMRRVLKPDGRAALQVLSTERAHFYGPQFTFTVEELRELLPGWAVAPDPEWRWHYIICQFPCATPATNHAT
jgi:ubiquinone/menaquinone biosynthesis C-methylase UbiE